MLNRIIKTFGLKGSWSWAKRQMMAGKIVRCKHWSGPLKIKIDSPENTLLLGCWDKGVPKEWEMYPYHLSYEDFTDYEVWAQQ